MNVGDSIRQHLGKIKALLHGVSGDLLIALLFIISTVFAFGLGRLSALHDTMPEVVFTKQNATAAAKNTLVERMTEGYPGSIVASKQGSKYHFPWCPGAQQMNEANKRWFADEAAARAAGYEPAGNCKGLE